MLQKNQTKPFMYEYINTNGFAAMIYKVFSDFFFYRKQILYKLLSYNVSCKMREVRE